MPHIREGFLPREGLYIDPIASFIKHTVLNPSLTLPLLAASLAASAISSIKGTPLWGYAGTILPCVVKLAALSILIHGNDYLSRRARNNYTEDPLWQGDWSNELVLITGAASEGGIGGSIVKRLSERNIKIIVVDISPMGYETGPNVHFYKCDLSDSKSVAHICATIRTEHGNPTVLINNAGISRSKTVVNGSYHDKELTIRTNLLAPFFLIQECLPHMIKQNHGHIVGASSMSAHVPPGGAADYAASKAGLIALHESLSIELSAKAPKIRLSLLVASFIRTPLTKSFETSLGKAPFITPLMHVDTVGDAIVNVLYSGYGRDLYVPGLMRYVAGIRGWPQWIQCLVRNGVPKTLLEREESAKASSLAI